MIGRGGTIPQEITIILILDEPIDSSELRALRWWEHEHGGVRQLQALLLLRKVADAVSGGPVRRPRAQIGRH